MKNRARQILSQHGLKVTGTRMKVLEYLLASRAHPSVEIIMEYLESKNMGISVSTLYNILDVFVEKGIIIKLREDESGMARYDARTDFHIHVFDGSDNSVVDLEDGKMTEKVRKLLEEIKREAGLDENARLVIEA